MNIIETKNERFKRLAAQRTISILDRIRVLGNCANRNDYEYSEEEVSKIFNAIERDLKKVRNQFSQTQKSNHKFVL